MNTAVHRELIYRKGCAPKKIGRLEVINFGEVFLRRPRFGLAWEDVWELEDVPEEPGLYRILRNDVIVYIGEATNLRNRLASHFASYDRMGRWWKGPNARLWRWGKMRQVEIEVCFRGLAKTRRKELEARLIDLYRPLLNGGGYRRDRLERFVKWKSR